MIDFDEIITKQNNEIKSFQWVNVRNNDTSLN